MSSNIVGYNKITMPTGLRIFGAQFHDVGGTTIDIQDVAGGQFVEADRLLFFDGGTYMSYSYDLSTYDDTWEKDLGPGWTDPVEGTRAIRSLSPGEGFWYDSKEGNTVTFSGEVPTNTCLTVPCNGILKIVSLPQPLTGIGINDLQFTGVTEADRLLFFNGSTYLSYSWDLSTYDDTWEKDLGPGWTDPVEGTRATKTVGIGEGFWLDAKSAEVTITLP